MDLEKTKIEKLLLFARKHVERFRMTSIYNIEQIMEFIMPFKPLIKTKDYVIFSIVNQVSLLLGNSEIASLMHYALPSFEEDNVETENSHFIRESYETKRFRDLLEEIKDEDTDLISISFFRDDFRKYFLSCSTAGDCSFILDNLPIHVARKNIMLIALNNDKVDFHFTVSEKLNEHLNYILENKFSIYDAQ